MLNVLHIYNREQNFFFKNVLRICKKMFTMWSVILDSAELFFLGGGQNWKLGGIPPKGA